MGRSRLGALMEMNTHYFKENKLNSVHGDQMVFFYWWQNHSFETPLVGLGLGDSSLFLSVTTASKCLCTLKRSQRNHLHLSRA